MQEPSPTSTSVSGQERFVTLVNQFQTTIDQNFFDAFNTFLPELWELFKTRKKQVQDLYASQKETRILTEQNRKKVELSEESLLTYMGALIGKTFFEKLATYIVTTSHTNADTYTLLQIATSIFMRNLLFQKSLNDAPSLSEDEKNVCEHLRIINENLVSNTPPERGFPLTSIANVYRYFSTLSKTVIVMQLQDVTLNFKEPIEGLYIGYADFSGSLVMDRWPAPPIGCTLNNIYGMSITALENISEAFQCNGTDLKDNSLNQARIVAHGINFHMDNRKLHLIIEAQHTLRSQILTILNEHQPLDASPLAAVPLLFPTSQFNNKTTQETYTDNNTPSLPATTGNIENIEELLQTPVAQFQENTMVDSYNALSIFLLQLWEIFNLRKKVGQDLRSDIATDDLLTDQQREKAAFWEKTLLIHVSALVQGNFFTLLATYIVTTPYEGTNHELLQIATSIFMRNLLFHEAPSLTEDEQNVCAHLRTINEDLVAQASPEEVGYPLTSVDNVSRYFEILSKRVIVMQLQDVTLNFKGPVQGIYIEYADFSGSLVAHSWPAPPVGCILNRIYCKSPLALHIINKAFECRNLRFKDSSPYNVLSNAQFMEKAIALHMENLKLRLIIDIQNRPLTKIHNIVYDQRLHRYSSAESILGSFFPQFKSLQQAENKKEVIGNNQQTPSVFKSSFPKLKFNQEAANKEEGEEEAAIKRNQQKRQRVG